MGFRDPKTHTYYWFIRCPSCQKDYSFRGVSHHGFIPIPILIRKLGYEGKCRKCKFNEIKDIITKFKEMKDKANDKTDKANDKTNLTKEEEEL